MTLLPAIVRIVHILIIIFMVIAPFLDDPLLLFLHIAGGLTLLLHWYMNNDACCLTIFESYLRGVDIDKSISGQFIRPMYNIPQGDWNSIIKGLTIILISISCVKLIVLVNPDFF